MNRKKSMFEPMVFKFKSNCPHCNKSVRVIVSQYIIGIGLRMERYYKQRENSNEKD